MAKKKINDSDFELDESGFDASASASKLPTDIRGGKEPLPDFMKIPTTTLDPFALKDDSDFSRPQPSGRFYEQFLASVKEVGVIEPLTVRAKQDGRYEILAGETRWTAAKDAGLRTVPCHIIDVDDATARKIFAWTNLLRRDLNVRDRINGWWQYYMGAKQEGNLQSLREDTQDDGLNKYVPSADRMSYRQLMRYVKMHDLTSEWIDLLEIDDETSKPSVTIRIGSEVAKLSKERQTELLPHSTKLTDKTIATVLALDGGTLTDEEGKVLPWNEENLLAIISEQHSTRGPVKRRALDEADRKLAKFRPKIMTIAKKFLHQEDYENAPEVIQEALELYYKTKSQE